MFWRIGYFIRDFWAEKGGFDRVLDVGSRNINGSVKDFISGYKEYIGVDMIEGKDVDLVCNGHDLLKHFKPESFDLVLCCETLEHDNKPWLTIEAMRKLVKPGGYLLITVPGIHFFRHDFPSDYYRYTDSAMREVMFETWENIHVEEYEDKNDICQHKPNNTVLGYAQKPQIKL